MMQVEVSLYKMKGLKSFCKSEVQVEREIFESMMILPVGLSFHQERKRDQSILMNKGE